MSITKLTLHQIASELPLCNRVAFCWSSSSTTSKLFTQKLSSYLSTSSSSVCRVGETLLVFIHNRNNSNDLTILLSFIHSVSSSFSTSSKIQFAFIDLHLTKQQQQQRNDDVNIVNDDKSLFSDLIKIQMVIDPIYSSTIKLPQHEEENIYNGNSDNATAHDDHGNTNKNNILKINHLVVPEEIIVLMMTRGQKANVETLLLDFFTTSLSSSSTSVVRWRRLFAEENEDKNSSIKNSSDKKRIDVLISRYCELFEIKDDENRTQSSSSMGNWQSTAVSNDERKWSVFVTQKMLSSSSSGSKQQQQQQTKNDASFHGEDTKNDNHENYFQGLFQHQVKTAAPALLSLFSNPVKISMHYERMLHDASNTIIDRRKQHASPLRKVMKYLSPVSSNHKHQDDGATNAGSRIEINTNENRNDNNVDDDDENDDETEAILRALTEKKKSMTLAKKAEEWFAELSSRGVPAPLKGLAMSLSYQYRFWLTPMGFLVIGSCLMLLMGVGLLFI